MWRLAIGVLAAAGVLYSWLNGWFSRHEEEEELKHAGQIEWDGEEAEGGEEPADVTSTKAD